MNLLAVILVCAASVAPADCSRENALDLVVSPAPSPIACVMGGEMTAARSLVESLRDGAYLKVLCERRKAS